MPDQYPFPLTTAKDLDKALRFYLDKADSEQLPDLILRERQQLLNDAQLLLARKLVQKKNESQDAVDLRRTLHARAKLTLTTSTDQERWISALPSNYLAFGRIGVQVNGEKVSSRISAPVIVPESRLQALLNDPFNQSCIDTPILAFGPDGIEVYKDSSYTATAVELVYYKLPTPLNVSTDQVPDLPEAVLPGVVQLAVKLALDTLEQPRTATQAPIANMTTDFPI